MHDNQTPKIALSLQIAQYGVVFLTTGGLFRVIRDSSLWLTFLKLVLLPDYVYFRFLIKAVQL